MGQEKDTQTDVRDAYIYGSCQWDLTAPPSSWCGSWSRHCVWTVSYSVFCVGFRHPYRRCLAGLWPPTSWVSTVAGEIFPRNFVAKFPVLILPSPWEVGSLYHLKIAPDFWPQDDPRSFMIITISEATWSWTRQRDFPSSDLIRYLWRALQVCGGRGRSGPRR